MTGAALVGYLDSLIAVAHHPIVRHGVIAVLLFQAATTVALLLWARASGIYDKGQRLRRSDITVRAVMLAPFRAMRWAAGGVAGALSGIAHDCRVIRRYRVKLLVMVAFLILTFGVFLDSWGMRLLDVASKCVLLLLTVYATRHTVFGLITAVAGVPWDELRPTTYEPDVLVLIPCHNEANVIVRLLDHLRALDYPADKLRIVVIDDASTDATLAVVTDYIARAAHDTVRRAAVDVYHRPPGVGGKGKSAALNAAIEAFGFGEIIAVFDADHTPNRDALRRMTRHYEDPKVGAFMGRCVPANRSDNLISGFVYLEYLVGYRSNMFAREIAGTTPAFGGSNCSVRRSLLEGIGLFKEGCLAEDTELTMCVYELGFLVRYDVTARNYEEATDNLKTYIKQRTRWARGHDQVSRAHSFRTLTSPHMTWRMRIEGFLFLQVYWMPVVYLVGIAITFVDYFVVPVYEFPYWAWVYFLFGPSLEVVAAAVRDREPARTWGTLALFPVFALIGMYIAVKAAWQELMGKTATWEKTARAADVTPGATLA